MALEIHVLPALTDNYNYILRDQATGATAVVDPSATEPTRSFLQQKGWHLDFILSTHHHDDHVGGNISLRQIFGSRVIGPTYDAQRIPGLDQAVSVSDNFNLGQSSAKILFIPGHTRGHIAYWFEKDLALFVGDTLFAMGCGRLFEGTPEQMFSSLNQLKALPLETKIYCGHEYTLKNGRFALSLDKENRDLARRMEEVEKIRQAGQPTIPTSLDWELKTNPFLRCSDPQIRAHLGMTSATDIEVFTELRQRRNQF